MIRVIRVKNKQEIAEKAFEIMHQIVTNKPDCTLGLATGSSPIGLYELMIKDHQENGTSYKDVTTFNLDEYVGLPKSHPESYFSFMHRNLFSGLDVKEENIHIPSSEGDLEDGGSRFVVLPVLYSKGWRAEVDAESVKLMQVNRCYSGFYVPKGAHHFKLTYSPPHWSLAVILTVFSWIIFIMTLGLPLVCRKTDKGEFIE